MAAPHHIDIAGVAVPTFLYGTAWKEEATESLVERAITEGFRGLDTANQRKHYDEAAVGRALATLFRRGSVRRADLFVQTKFTFLGGQDHRLPYDAGAPVHEQVAQSFRSSLEHLGVDHLDAYLLHGPSQRIGLGDADLQAWAAMEALHDAGGVRLIGVSNVSPRQLRALYEAAGIKPALVQNRCYARTGWDAAVRTFCAEHGIGYQGFSLLTANLRELADPTVRTIAERHGRTPAQVVFRFALHAGMLPLTGTTSAPHMRTDLEALDFDLEPHEVERIERIATEEPLD